MAAAHNVDAAIKAAVLEHQKGCLEEIRETLGNIWRSIQKISEHQDRLTNDENTGKVDVLWAEREKKLEEERERRRYWTRWIVGTAVLFLLGNLGIFAWFLSKIEAVLKVARP